MWNGLLERAEWMMLPQFSCWGEIFQSLMLIFFETIPERAVEKWKFWFYDNIWKKKPTMQDD